MGRFGSARSRSKSCPKNNGLVSFSHRRQINRAFAASYAERAHPGATPGKVAAGALLHAIVRSSSVLRMKPPIILPFALFVAFPICAQNPGSKSISSKDSAAAAVDQRYGKAEQNMATFKTAEGL